MRTLSLAAIAWFFSTGALSAQDISGLWHYSGFTYEATAGFSPTSNILSESGTLSFAPKGDHVFGVTITGTDNDSFDATITQTGNTFSTSLPSEPGPEETIEHLVEITVYDDFAILVSVESFVSTAEGLEGQSFASETSVFVLSRSPLPAPRDELWAGEYAFRLNGLRFVAGSAGFKRTVHLPSITISSNAGSVTGVVAGSTLPDLAFTAHAAGLQDLAAIPQDGAYDTVVTRDQLNKLVWTIQIDDERIALLQARVLIGTVNTGTVDEYSVIAETLSSGGIARRTMTAAPSFLRQPTDVAVVSGGDAFFSVEAAGAPAPSFAWEISSDGGISWDSLVNFDETNYAGAETSTLVVSSAAGVDGDQFRVTITNSQGSVTSDPATLTILPAPTARLPNLSVRTTLNAAQNLIVGFVMTGGSKPLLLRAVGPQLGEFGVETAMPDPRISFFDVGGTQIADNDNWLQTDAALFDQLGAFAFLPNSKDAALRVDLAGPSTANVTGDQGGTVLVEVYDVGDNNDVRLANVSARNQVGTGENILIAGFVVTGADPKNILVRGVGPGLRQFGLTDVLNDPKVEIYQESTLIASNDNWSEGVRPSFNITGAFDLDDNSLDAALVITLPPGAYTVQVSGADGGTGEALAEVYELP